MDLLGPELEGLCGPQADLDSQDTDVFVPTHSQSICVLETTPVYTVPLNAGLSTMLVQFGLSNMSNCIQLVIHPMGYQYVLV